MNDRGVFCVIFFVYGELSGRCRGICGGLFDLVKEDSDEEIDVETSIGAAALLFV